jgi:hypothetical protein
MSNKKPVKRRTRIIDSASIGLYLWQLPNGEYLSDNEGNFLNVASRKDDLVKMTKLRQVAAHYGYPEGQPVYYSGARRVTDEEFDIQIQRMIAGLIPDEYDVGAYMDEARYRKQHGTS